MSLFDKEFVFLSYILLLDKTDVVFILFGGNVSSDFSLMKVGHTIHVSNGF